MRDADLSEDWIGLEHPPELSKKESNFWGGRKQERKGNLGIDWWMD